MPRFSVTYATVTEDSARDGDYADSGYLAQDVSLREAIAAIGYVGHLGYCEADSSRISLEEPPRWFSFPDEEGNYRTGERTDKALHLPEGLTPSSRMRIARLLGCYGVKR